MIKREEKIETFGKKRDYLIIDKLNNTALIYFDNDYTKKALMNLETGEIIGKTKDYKINKLDDFFILIYKELDENAINLTEITKVFIYDTINKEILCDNWELIFKFADITYVLKNPYTNKYHIINRNKKEDFNNGYDKVEEIETQYINLYIVTQGGRKAIYNNGLISDFIFEGDIKIQESTLKYKEDEYRIFDVNGKKALYYNEFKTKIEYDNIYVKEGTLVLTKGEKTYLYQGNYFKLDNTTCVKSNNLTFIDDVIIIKEDKRIKLFENNKITLSIYADELYYEKDAYVLKYEKDNLYGLVEKNYYGNCIAPIYKKITINGMYYFALKDTGLYDIYAVDNIRRDVLEKVSIEEEITENLMILKSKDNYIIFDINGFDKHIDKLKIDKLKTKPRYVGNNYFILEEKDDNEELTSKIYYKGKRIVTLSNYDSYELKPEFDILKVETKRNGYKWKLVLLYKNPAPANYNDETLDIHGYFKVLTESNKPIKFTNDFAIIEYTSYVYLRLLKTLEEMTIDQPFIVKKVNDIEYYFINKEWDIYDPEKNDFVKIEKIPVSSYNASYETDYGTIIVSEFNKETYDYKCKLIEESDPDKILEDYYNNTRRLQLMYPNLKKK